MVLIYELDNQHLIDHSYVHPSEEINIVQDRESIINNKMNVNQIMIDHNYILPNINNVNINDEIVKHNLIEHSYSKPATGYQVPDEEMLKDVTSCQPPEQASHTLSTVPGNQVPDEKMLEDDTPLQPPETASHTSTVTGSQVPHEEKILNATPLQTSIQTRVKICTVTYQKVVYTTNTGQKVSHEKMVVDVKSWQTTKTASHTSTVTGSQVPDEKQLGDGIPLQHTEQSSDTISTATGSQVPDKEQLVDVKSEQPPEQSSDTISTATGSQVPDKEQLVDVKSEQPPEQSSHTISTANGSQVPDEEQLVDVRSGQPPEQSSQTISTATGSRVPDEDELVVKDLFRNKDQRRVRGAKVLPGRKKKSRLAPGEAKHSLSIATGNQVPDEDELVVRELSRNKDQQRVRGAMVLPVRKKKSRLARGEAEHSLSIATGSQVTNEEKLVVTDKFRSKAPRRVRGAMVSPVHKKRSRLAPEEAEHSLSIATGSQVPNEEELVVTDKFRSKAPRRVRGAMVSPVHEKRSRLAPEEAEHSLSIATGSQVPNEEELVVTDKFRSKAPRRVRGEMVSPVHKKRSRLAPEEAEHSLSIATGSHVPEDEEFVVVRSRKRPKQSSLTLSTATGSQVPDEDELVVREFSRNKDQGRVQGAMVLPDRKKKSRLAPGEAKHSLSIATGSQVPDEDELVVRDKSRIKEARRVRGAMVSPVLIKRSRLAPEEANHSLSIATGSQVPDENEHVVRDKSCIKEARRVRGSMVSPVLIKRSRLSPEEAKHSLSIATGSLVPEDEEFVVVRSRKPPKQSSFTMSTATGSQVPDEDELIVRELPRNKDPRPVRGAMVPPVIIKRSMLVPEEAELLLSRATGSHVPEDEEFVVVRSRTPPKQSSFTMSTATGSQVPDEDELVVRELPRNKDPRPVRGAMVPPVIIKKSMLVPEEAELSLSRATGSHVPEDEEFVVVRSRKPPKQSSFTMSTATGSQVPDEDELVVRELPRNKDPRPVRGAMVPPVIIKRSMLVPEEAELSLSRATGSHVPEDEEFVVVRSRKPPKQSSFTRSTATGSQVPDEDELVVRDLPRNKEPRPVRGALYLPERKKRSRQAPGEPEHSLSIATGSQVPNKEELVVKDKSRIKEARRAREAMVSPVIIKRSKLSPEEAEHSFSKATGSHVPEDEEFVVVRSRKPPKQSSYTTSTATGSQVPDEDKLVVGGLTQNKDQRRVRGAMVLPVRKKKFKLAPGEAEHSLSIATGSQVPDEDELVVRDKSRIKEARRVRGSMVSPVLIKRSRLAPEEAKHSLSIATGSHVPEDEEFVVVRSRKPPKQSSFTRSTATGSQVPDEDDLVVRELPRNKDPRPVRGAKVPPVIIKRSMLVPEEAELLLSRSTGCQVPYEEELVVRDKTRSKAPRRVRGAIVSPILIKRSRLAPEETKHSLSFATGSHVRNEEELVVRDFSRNKAPRRVRGAMVMPVLKKRSRLAPEEAGHSLSIATGSHVPENGEFVVVRSCKAPKQFSHTISTASGSHVPNEEEVVVRDSSQSNASRRVRGATILPFHKRRSRLAPEEAEHSLSIATGSHVPNDEELVVRDSSQSNASRRVRGATILPLHKRRSRLAPEEAEHSLSIASGSQVPDEEPLVDVISMRPSGSASHTSTAASGSHVSDVEPSEDISSLQRAEALRSLYLAKGRQVPNEEDLSAIRSLQSLDNADNLLSLVTGNDSRYQGHLLDFTTSNPPLHPARSYSTLPSALHRSEAYINNLRRKIQKTNKMKSKMNLDGRSNFSSLQSIRPDDDIPGKNYKNPMLFLNSINTFSDCKMDKLCESGDYVPSEESDKDDICITLDKRNRSDEFDISIKLNKTDSIEKMMELEKLNLPGRMTKPFRSEKLNNLDLLFSGQMANALPISNEPAPPASTPQYSNINQYMLNYSHTIISDIQLYSRTFIDNLYFRYNKYSTDNNIVYLECEYHKKKQPEFCSVTATLNICSRHKFLKLSGLHNHLPPPPPLYMRAQ